MLTTHLATYDGIIPLQGNPGAIVGFLLYVGTMKSGVGIAVLFEDQPVMTLLCSCAVQNAAHNAPNSSATAPVSGQKSQKHTPSHGPGNDSRSVSINDKMKSGAGKWQNLAVLVSDTQECALNLTSGRGTEARVK